MLLSNPKLSELNQSTSGILLPYLLSKQPVITSKTFGFALAHLSTSNSFALPQTNITSLLLLLRNASTPLLMTPPLQTLAIFGIPSTLSSSVSLFFLHWLLLNHFHRCSLFSSQTKFSNCIPLKCPLLLSLPHFPPKNTPTILSSFSLVSEDELSKIISQSSNSFSDIDSIPTYLLKQCVSALLPTLTIIINLSLASGTFPDQFKSCSDIPLLKKYNLDK